MAYNGNKAQQRFAKEVARHYSLARTSKKADKFMEDFREGLRSGQIDDSRISVASLWDALVEDGYEARRMFDPKNSDSSLMEDASTVSTAHFANITGQIVYNRMLDAFADPSFLHPHLVETIPTEFDGEKIPGIGRIGDFAQQVNEGGEYPTAGLSEEWVETPPTIKRGLIVPVTKEALFFDRTGLVLQKAGEVGHFIGVNKEKRVLDVALGITTTYRRNGLAAQATYGNSHTGGDFDNLAASNALVDWTDIEAALLLFDAITDPNTGEPIDLSMPLQIVVPSALKMTSQRIVNATQVRYGAPGSTSNVTLADSPNPLNTADYAILTNQYVKSRTSSDTTWFIGDFKRAFAYMENWPVTVTQAPANSHLDFTRDIVSQFKVSERGAAACLEPRRVVKATA